jgi:membrane protein YqaA with SNARE-associated domain
VIAITVYVYNIRDQAEQLARYGYPGIFLLSILANATVLLPAPGIVFVFFMGAVFNPVGVAIAAGLGAAIGEMSGYLAGFSGQAIVENTTYYQRILGWMENNQFKASMVILVLAFIPNPFFDLAGISAGTLRMPVIRFLFFCAIGKILKMFIFAYAGYAGITTLQEFFSP